MDKEHFETTLQATFFGDKNAFNLCLKEYKNLRQALNEIRKVINDCRKLMSHEFDWEEQADNILQIIGKVLGEENEVTK